MRLTEHFTLEELTKSCIAQRHGLDNTPDADAVAALRYLAYEVLEPVRRHYDRPITPSSGYRSLELNRLVGSKDSSQHILGQAVDFEVAGIPNMAVAHCVASLCKFDQLILEFYHEGQPHSGWVHVSVKETGNRGQCLIFDGINYSPTDFGKETT